MTMESNYRKHLKTFLPKTYQQMKAEGRLDEHVRWTVEKASDQIATMMSKHGLNEDQAKELVQDLLYPTPEKGQENNLL